MHPFFIQFLIHFRLSPLQCVPNVFRIVMGTAVLIDKLGLNLTVHDITYVYRLQVTGKKQYTLVVRHWERKLVTGLLDSSKGRDKDFLVITGNWKNPFLSCPLILGVPGFCRFIKLPSFFFSSFLTFFHSFFSFLSFFFLLIVCFFLLYFQIRILQRKTQLLWRGKLQSISLKDRASLIAQDVLVQLPFFLTTCPRTSLFRRDLLSRTVDRSR